MSRVHRHNKQRLPFLRQYGTKKRDVVVACYREGLSEWSVLEHNWNPEEKRGSGEELME